MNLFRCTAEVSAASPAQVGSGESTWVGADSKKSKQSEKRVWPHRPQSGTPRNRKDLLLQESRASQGSRFTKPECFQTLRLSSVGT